MATPATREQQGELYGLAYELDQIFQGQGRKSEADALGDVSRWIDAHPTVRLDNSADPDEVDDDTKDLAVLLAISKNPASVPIYNEIVRRQPDILAKKFMHDMTLVEYIQSELDEIAAAGGRGAGILRQKLNPTLKADLALDRLLGKPADDRKGNPLPRGVSDMVRYAVTGVPLEEQKSRVTLRGGRRKTKARKTLRRKTKRATRKTK
jgi:hypothetical protein